MVNGYILEGFDERGEPIWHHGMLVRDGRVAYLGDNPEEISAPGSKVVDLRGRVVLPGFIDAHLHVLEVGASTLMLDLRGVESIAELKRLVSEKAGELGVGEWILGRGWDQERFIEKRLPTRWDLDEVSPLNPVLLVRVCGHMAVANTLALRLAGIDESTPDPPGGEISRSCGRITGVLKETAIELVRRVIPEVCGSTRRIVERALGLLASSGITTVHGVSVGREELEALIELSKRGKLPVRVRVYVRPELLNSARRGEVNDCVSVMGIKIFLDGSFGARTAALREPYSDDPSTSGFLLYSDEELASTLRRACRAGLQVAVHAIGDLAVEQLLRVLNRESIPGRVIRVEHASLSPPDLMAEMKHLGINVVVQPHFVISDWWIVERLGSRRCRWVYAFKSLLKSNLLVAFSSDAPVEPYNPWEGVYAAVTRGKYEGRPLASLTLSEALSVNEAIRCYTEIPARLTGDALGRLSKGFPADFIIVGLNPFKIGDRDLNRIRILSTYVNGIRVH